MSARIPPGLGLAGAVLTMIGLALADIAGLDRVNPLTPAETIAREIAEHAKRLHSGSSLLLVGLSLLVWFFAYLPERLTGRSAASPAGWAARVSGWAGLLVLALTALVAAYVRAATHTPVSGTEAVILKGLVYYDWDYLRTMSPFVSASLMGTGVASLVAGTLPRAVGWGCVVLAPLPLIIPPGLVTMAYFLVIAVISAYLVVRPEVEPASPRAGRDGG